MSRCDFDLSDLDRYIGQQVVFNELREPCHTTDIRRWVQAMDYPNPVHWDEDFAKTSRFGGIIAPQSFTVAMDYGHGCHPTCIGKIPGGHLIFAGEEWWFYGGLLRPGDRLVQERRFDGYSVADTKFAGPTVFARGDTIHRTEDGTMFAKERATAVRYLVEEAKNVVSMPGRSARPANGPVKNWPRSPGCATPGSSPTARENHHASTMCRSATSCRAA